NTVTIYTFDCAQSTSGSDSLYDTAGNSVSDAADYNFTTGNNDTTTFTYSWYMANDGEGYLTSQDPIYEIELYPVLWMELSGTGYESITLSGWDGKYERGSTMYHYKILGETEITRYKVGQDYVYPGAGSFSFSFDASGTSDNDEVLGQIYLKIYSDPQYHKDYGSYGPYAFTLFEHTVDD
ncbi:MAG: hypothetical protein GWO08_02945, partial [Gammaproteobacteria bacterium]|nr:hypothetical protein [Gammaproteobacteria bacterium]